MDIYCVRCGEPWDIDSLHEETDHRQESGEEISFNGVRRDFSRRGCLAMTVYRIREGECVRDSGNARAMASSALMGILGDDIDGVASLMDDGHAMGMFR